MQISASSSSALTTLQPSLQPGTQASGSGNAASSALPVAEVAANASTAPAQSEVIHVSASRPESKDLYTPVYAEIWRDGVKVAEVDSRGSVTGVNGFIPPIIGSSGGGPEIAARRASQVALAVGGEIRSNGQLLDQRTLTMRARLQTAYRG